MEQGARFVLGTDCSACNDTMNIQQEIRAVSAALSFAATQSDAHRRFRESGSLEDAQEAMRTQKHATKLRFG